VKNTYKNKYLHPPGR